VNRIRIWAWFLLAVLALPVAASAAVRGELDLDAIKSEKAFQEIIDRRCTVCHTRERIDAARREKRDLAEIQRQMEERGAILTPEDKKIMGTFWGSPLKSAEEKPSTELTLKEEYRAILETRCVHCHSLDRIDEAIARQIPFASVEEILLQRGVILTERERSVLGTFWGSPLREK